MKDIVFASSNPGKLKEIQELLADSINVIPQREFNVSDVDETGLTFVENAIIKARHAAKITGSPALADDSGLEVDVLEGRPGIYSARFAGLGAKSEDNNRKLLNELQGVPEEKRTARFHCLLVLMRFENDPTPILCHGTWEGRIMFEPRGVSGFGYDPVFYVPSQNCTAAELDPIIKNQLSHRGQALAKLYHEVNTHEYL